MHSIYTLTNIVERGEHRDVCGSKIKTRSI